MVGHTGTYWAGSAAGPVEKACSDQPSMFLGLALVGWV